MSILTIIIGVLIIAFGIFCLMTPGITLLSIGWMLGLMLLIAGINLIMGYFALRKTIDIGPLSLVLGIITALLGIVMLINQPMRLITDVIAVYMLGAWMLIMGIGRIADAFRFKSIPDSGWGWYLVLGILMAGVGIYSFFHPAVSALTLAWLIGFYVIVTGVDLISMGVTMMRSSKQNP